MTASWKFQESTEFSFAVSETTLNISGQYYLMVGITDALGLQATALTSSLIKGKWSDVLGKSSLIWRDVKEENSLSIVLRSHLDFISQFHFPVSFRAKSTMCMKPKLITKKISNLGRSAFSDIYLTLAAPTLLSQDELLSWQLWTSLFSSDLITITNHKSSPSLTSMFHQTKFTKRQRLLTLKDSFSIMSLRYSKHIYSFSFLPLHASRRLATKP